jgi:hypothetical protein
VIDSSKPLPASEIAQYEKKMIETDEKRLQFDRTKVLNRYWELASLAPDMTKGSITGQLDALDSLCSELARTPGEKTRQTPQPSQFYRSHWSRPS